jgi:CO/xanthine dehydrogenase FAD-binding subunit
MRPDMEYVRPDTLDEALEYLRRRTEDTRVVAGGTDVLIGIRSGVPAAGCLLDITRLPELKEIAERGGELFVGAGVTVSEILSSAAVGRFAPALQKAASAFGSRQIRNMATIGGNVCRASPAGDTLPPLYALDAEVELQSHDASRRIPLREFIVGPGRTALGAGEILRGIWLKGAPDFRVHRFEKVGNRKALAVSIVSLAALLHVSDSGVIERVRLAWGSVAPTVVRSLRVESFLTGKPLSSGTLDEAVPLVHQAVSPIDDIRASAAYRRTVAGNLLLRLVEHGERELTI